MSQTSDNNKRIAKNTIFLYVRLLFLLIANFYTSRVVLDKLGVQDFGIYNVVGGFAIIFVFFRSSLANATQRYLNVELGKNNTEGVHKIFCLHQSIYILISIVLFILAETVGTWFVLNKLIIPPSRMVAAFWVYQFTILSLIVTILSVVYDAIIVAKENMKIYSYVGIFEGLAKLTVAFLIAYSPYDRLVTYGFLLLIVALGIRLFYSFYCRKKYEESKFRFDWNIKSFKEALGMIGWNSIGAAVYAINDQGINVLLNLFFGPTVNAARAVAFQVSGAIGNFGLSFYTSVRPQLVKSYSVGNYEYLYKLFFYSSKYSVFLLWLMCLPVMLSIDFFLNIWLTKIPEYTNIFTLLVLLYSIVNVLNQPIWSLALAIGKLKYYMLIGSGVFLMSFPISYVCLKMGASPISVFVINILVRCIYIIAVLEVLNKYIRISMKQYFFKVVKPTILVIGMSSALSLIINSFLGQKVFERLSISCLSIVINTVCIYSFGLNKNEKIKFISTIKQKISCIK